MISTHIFQIRRPSWSTLSWADLKTIPALQAFFLPPFTGASTFQMSYLPATAQGILVVVENSFNQTFSYRIDGHVATFLGEGDPFVNNTGFIFEHMEESQEVHTTYGHPSPAKTRSYNTLATWMLTTTNMYSESILHKTWLKSILQTSLWFIPVLWLEYLLSRQLSFCCMTTL